MVLEEARRKAHALGQSYRPAPVEDFNLVDVADLYYEVLDETHPADQAPSPRHESAKYEAWKREQEEIRQEIWEAFEAGLRGLPFKEKMVAVQ